MNQRLEYPLSFFESMHYTNNNIILSLSLEHCPKLESLQLHITLQLYFPESTHSKPDTFSTYEQIVANLRVGHQNHKISQKQ